MLNCWKAMPNPERKNLSTTLEANRESLCEFCFKSLSLDDALAGGTLKTSSDGSKTSLSFPGHTIKAPMYSVSHADGKINSKFTWKGGNDYKRTVTPPDLPELSSVTKRNAQCRFCTVLGGVAFRAFGNDFWWYSTTVPLEIEVEYWWKGACEGYYHEVDDPAFSLNALYVTLRHPAIETAGNHRFHFDIAASPGICRDWLRIKRNPLDRQDSLSPRNAEMIRHWIEGCCKDSTCNQYQRPGGFLPRRLLDIGTGGISEEVKLIETEVLPPQDARYACLSYCWGHGLPPIRTTVKTLEDHKQGISPGNLPQLFKDAISTSRTLEIRYLWIDALCIIQDSESDWEEQAGKMATIFRHSFITIGAAGTTSCQGSFLRRRPHEYLDLDFRSSLDSQSQGKFSIHLMKRDAEEWDGSMERPWDRELKSCEWNRRAWVWQEQNMPERIIIFGDEMVQMRCHQRLLSEDGSVSFDNRGPFDFQRAYTGNWMPWLLDNYCNRKLTYRRDKLAAVAGPAKSLQAAIQKRQQAPEYLTGLWLDTSLGRNLLWAIDKPRMSFNQMLIDIRAYDVYVAPSWSWASRDEKVVYGFSYLTNVSICSCFEVLSYQLIPAESDAAIRARPGSDIIVRTEFAKASHRLWSGEPQYNESFEYRLDWDPRLDNHDGCSPELDMYLIRTVDTRGLILFPTALDEMKFVRVGVFLFRERGGDLSDLDAKRVFSKWTIRDVTLL